MSATLVGTLAAITTRLADVVAAENEILRSRRPAELAAWQDEKEKLTGAYERQLSALKQNPALLQSSQGAEVDRLKQATRRFQELLEEHRRMVQSAKAISERMLKAIAEEVAARRGTVGGYDQNAGLRNTFDDARRPVSLALNQVV